MPGKNSTKRKIIIKIITMNIFFMALFFIPAGTLNWPEAWLFLVLYFLWMGLILLWLKKNDPGLLVERMTARKKKDVKGWDRAFMSAYSLLILGLIIVTGLDAVRFGWSRVPLTVEIIGFLCLLPPLILVFWTMRENTFLSEMVRIQQERGHRVCTTGPYKYVRHPMYVGVIISLPCLPLALGSYYALIPAFLSVILFFFRTSMEDKTLQNELPGYKEYAQKVPFKLIPGIW